MKRIYIAFLLITLLCEACAVKQQDSKPNVIHRRYDPDGKKFIAEFEEREAKLNSGGYLKNKKIKEYLGVWESEDKSIKVKIETERRKITRTEHSGKEINIELDVLLLTELTVRNKPGTTPEEYTFKEPIVLENLKSDMNYLSGGLENDPIYNSTFMISLRLNKNSLMMYVLGYNNLQSRLRTVLPRRNMNLRKIETVK